MTEPNSNSEPDPGTDPNDPETIRPGNTTKRRLGLGKKFSGGLFGGPAMRRNVLARQQATEAARRSANRRHGGATEDRDVVALIIEGRSISIPVDEILLWREGEREITELDRLTTENLRAVLEQAQRFFRGGRVYEAETLFEIYGHRHRDDAEALERVGAFLFRSMAFVEAVDVFDRVLEIDPKRYATWLDRAMCHLRIGMAGAARRDLERILKSGIEPGSRVFRRAQKVLNGIEE